MDKCIHVLHVIRAMDRGGAETMIMNLYRRIDRSRIQFDFLVHVERKCDYDDEILRLGGRIFRVVPYRIYNYFSYKKQCGKILEEHPEVKIVHGHIGSCASVYLRVANKRQRYTIAHSHAMNKMDNVADIIFKIMTFDNRWLADFYLGCSNEAGIDQYGKKVAASEKFQVLNNGIDAGQYCYNAEMQKHMKKSLGFEEKIVFGHVGRFIPLKNHKFLVEIFREIEKIEPRAEFILVGRGELEDKIKDRVHDMGIADKVHFLGVREDIAELMIMMDGFIFPSIHEGLGIVAVEAQAAGLPCVISEGIPDEAVVTENVKRLELSLGAETWAKTILQMYKDTQRSSQLDAIKKADYDISVTVRQLENIYCNAVKEEK
ncbi:glycosyltransferase family 1 protein [Ruminococcus sp. 5_1_39BFAA]|uniref:glycosyltransferase family 1 protein n=1 Tax=Ruminococcus sp. 5_1_39BFAA TaxID=457412 RepID=UPI0035645596